MHGLLRCMWVQSVYSISLQVQRDPRDNEVIKEYHLKSKATLIIHTLEPNGKELGNPLYLE